MGNWRSPDFHLAKAVPGGKLAVMGESGIFILAIETEMLDEVRSSLDRLGRLVVPPFRADRAALTVTLALQAVSSGSDDGRSALGPLGAIQESSGA